MEFLAAQVINGLVLGAVLALFALGFSLVLADLKVFNVAHFGVFSWSAIIGYLIITHLHAPFWLAVVLAAAAGSVGSVLVYALVVRHLLHKSGREMSVFISSLGALIALQEFGDLVIGGGNTVGLPPNSFPSHVWRFGQLIDISSIDLIIVGISVLSLAVLWFMMARSQAGRRIKAVASDREVAGLLGINAELVTVGQFALSGGMAGLAGILIGATFNAISGEMGTTYGLLAVAIAVIGGFGSLPGVMVGSVIVGVISSLTAGYISSSYEDAVVFGFVLLLLLWRPAGLLRVMSGDGKV